MSDFTFQRGYHFPLNTREVSVLLGKFSYPPSDIKLRIKAVGRGVVVEYAPLQPLDSDMRTTYRLDDKVLSAPGQYRFQLVVTFKNETVILETWQAHSSGRGTVNVTIADKIFKPLV